MHKFKIHARFIVHCGAGVENSERIKMKFWSITHYILNGRWVQLKYTRMHSRCAVLQCTPALLSVEQFIEFRWKHTHTLSLTFTLTLTLAFWQEHWLCLQMQIEGHICAHKSYHSVSSVFLSLSIFFARRASSQFHCFYPFFALIYAH